MNNLIKDLLTETFEDFRQRALELIQDLENAALIDELTSCLNRQAFEKRKLMLEDRQQLYPIGVMYVDVNDLKKVNDRQGHDAGDIILVDLGKMLKAYWGSIDTYRVGGDEFIVLQMHVDPEKFMDQVTRFIRAYNTTHTIKSSIGCSFTEGSRDLDQTILEAEKNMRIEKCKYHKNK